jgi:hypothetical protein
VPTTVVVGEHAGAPALIENEEVVAVAPFASVTVAMMGNDPPATVVVPLMTPVEAFSVRPEGREPETEYVKGERPPVTPGLSPREYALPNVAVSPEVGAVNPTAPVVVTLNVTSVSMGAHS